MLPRSKPAQSWFAAFDRSGCALQQIWADSESRLLVTDSRNRNLAAQIAPEKSIVYFEEHSSARAQNLNLPIAPGDLAVLIYTSGTTGRPKGVMQSHRSALHNALRLSHGARITAEDRITLLASPSGGQGLSTLLCALLNGATLCPFAASEQSASLKSWLTTHAVTVYVSSVSIFRHFMKSLGDGDILRGIELRSALVLKKPPSVISPLIENIFPIAASCSIPCLPRDRQRHAALLRSRIYARRKIARRLAASGMEILLVGENGREVGTEEIGEIIVRSRYLSPGYWRNDSLTAQRFSEDSAGNGLRRFRTGDFGSRDATGALTFADRKDNRVKIHGYRIEISEVEDALNQLPETEQAIVHAQTAENGDTRLVAYLVLRAGVERSATDLRRKLFAILPNYMVPGSFVFLDKFPLTPHGKIDRHALPAPQRREKFQSCRFARQRDVVEKNLVKIFEAVLRVSPVGRRDDFFDLGGTSLQSVEAMKSIEEIFNVALPPSTLIERSTIEDLAPLLSGHAVIASPQPLVTLREEGQGQPLFPSTAAREMLSPMPSSSANCRRGPCTGLQAVDIQGESWPLMSIPEMAEPLSA